MLYASLKLIHLLSIVVWVGGMVFAHFFLRPATQALEPAVRVRLMHDVLERFFAAVLVAVVLMLASGVWMIGNFARQVVQSGGSFAMPLGWTVMATLGLVMVASSSLAIAESRDLSPLYYFNRHVMYLGLGIVLATIASALNLVTGLLLIRAGKRYRSITLEADGRHLMTDVWTSVGVIAGVGAALAFGARTSDSQRSRFW